MKASHILFAGVMAVALASCQKIIGEGPVETETRNLSGFAGIDLRTSADVYFKQDSVYKVEVSAQRNLMDRLETEVNDNKLVIKTKAFTWPRAKGAVRITVSAPSLASLRVSGSGNINTTSAITTNRLDADISGSGNINITELHASYTDAAISGSGDMTVNGGASADVRTKISGSGKVNFSDLEAQTATTKTTGSGNTRVNVSQHLDVTITGSGSVYYKGNPSVDVRISGSGKVMRL